MSYPWKVGRRGDGGGGLDATGEAWQGDLGGRGGIPVGDEILPEHGEHRLLPRSGGARTGALGQRCSSRQYRGLSLDSDGLHYSRDPPNRNLWIQYGGGESRITEPTMSVFQFLAIKFCTNSSWPQLISMVSINGGRGCLWLLS